MLRPAAQNIFDFLSKDKLSYYSDAEVKIFECLNVFVKPTVVGEYTKTNTMKTTFDFNFY